MRRKTLMAGLCALLVIAGLTACGKRGDPYRPAEIPTQQTSSYAVADTVISTASSA
jgi:predicted small lipoprotein YifL